MDFSTVYKRLKGFGAEKAYNGSHAKFARDIRLIFRNCLTYNAEDSEIANDAERLSNEFEELYSVWVLNSTRTNWDDVLGKLPPIPDEWLDLDIEDNEEAGTRDDGTIGDPDSVAALKRKLRKLRATLSRIAKLDATLLNDDSLIATPQQLEMIAARPKLSDEVKKLERSITTKEIVEEERVERARLQRMVDCSGKLVLVDKLLPKLRREGHRVLLFSQFKLMLNIIQQYVIGRGWPCERIDGDVDSNERQLSIDRFSDPTSDAFMFLLSTKAGGVGINLTAADTVIIYDSDWNPQNDLQATARCHRIGQTNAVTIYRLITRRTYEGEMFDRASRKLGLERAVMSGNAAGDSSVFASTDAAKKAEDLKKMSGAELEDLLKKGAYAMLNDDGKASREFCERTIDDILMKNTRTVVHDEGGASFAPRKKAAGSSTVQSTTFTSADADAGLDVEDPEFWQKLMPGMRSARALMARLNDESALKSEETKDEFFKEMALLVEEITTAKANGDEVSPHEWETTKSIALQVSCMRSVFKSEYCDDAEGWFQVLTGSRKRKPVKRLAVTKSPPNSAKKRKNVRAPTRSNPSRRGGNDDDDSSDFDSDDAVSSEDGMDWNPRRRARNAYNEKDAWKAYHANRSKLEHLAEFCGICEQGGDLLCCDGPCKRFFHLACLGMDKLPSGSRWHCPDCASKMHMCLMCGATGPDAEDFVSCKESQVIKCSHSRCGRFYHRQCLVGNSTIKWLKDGVETRYPSSANGFHCPLHRCKFCGEDHSESDKQFLKCHRCEDAFHVSCIDHGSCYIIDQHYCVCAQHVERDQIPDWGEPDREGWYTTGDPPDLKAFFRQEQETMMQAPDKRGVVKRVRRGRCGECAGCLVTEDCGKCKRCKNKKNSAEAGKSKFSAV